MLGNLIFSLSVALPIFLVMLTGFILKEKNVINDNFIKAANFIVFYVALPLKLFNSVLASDVADNFDLKFMSFIIILTIISVILVWIVASFFIKEKSKKGAFIHAGFRGNFVYVGLSLLENVTGSIGSVAPLIIAFIIPLYNILAVLVLTFTNKNNKSGNNLLNSLKSMLKNPFIIAIFLGIIGSLTGFELPNLVDNTVQYFSNLATPLALVTIGATFNLQQLFANIMPSLIASLVKLVFLPAVMVLSGLLFSFSNYELFLIYILFGVPSATVSYIMTAAMGGDRELAASIVMMTTLLSVITMTVFVFIFKTIGMV